jgi:hypothetical protein
MNSRRRKSVILAAGTMGHNLEMELHKIFLTILKIIDAFVAINTNLLLSMNKR